MDHFIRNMFGYNKARVLFSGGTISGTTFSGGAYSAVIPAPPTGYRWIVDTQSVASTGVGGWRLRSATVTAPLILHEENDTEESRATVIFGHGESVGVDTAGSGEGTIEYHKEL